MIRSRLCLALLTAGLVASTARAQPASAAPEAAPAPPCTTGQRSAISEIACELSTSLAGLPGGALVVLTPVTSDAKLQAPEKLIGRVARVVAGALGNGAQAAAEPADLARARSLAREAGTLVHLAVALTLGELRVTANVYPVPKNFWDRVRDPRPSPSAHAFASRRLDPELRTFLPPVPLVASRVDKAKSPEQSPVAVGCGDVDRDGALELVLVGRRDIRVGRVRASRFVPHATAKWADASPIAQSPMREPLASVAITPGRHVDIGLSDRARMLRFAPDLSLIGDAGRRIPWPTGGCSRFQGISLLPQIIPCLPGDPQPTPDAFAHATDAVAGARLLDARGELRSVLGGRIANEPAVVLHDRSDRRGRVDGVGAQLAVGDVDGDGQPELVTGSNTLNPEGDALIVSTWQADGTVAERYRLAVPTGVHAVGICPPESAGAAAIVVASRGSIWIVR